MQFWDGYGKMSIKMEAFWTECEEFGWMKGPLIGRQELTGLYFLVIVIGLSGVQFRQ